MADTSQTSDKPDKRCFVTAQKDIEGTTKRKTELTPAHISLERKIWLNTLLNVTDLSHHKAYNLISLISNKQMRKIYNHTEELQHWQLMAYKENQMHWSGNKNVLSVAMCVYMCYTEGV